MKKLIVVALILAGYAVGQATKTPQAPRPAKAQSPAAEAEPTRSQPGRYQMFFSPHARADMYLLDTETGRIWKPVTISNAKDTNLQGSTPQVWLYQDRVDTEQEFDLWIALHKLPPSAPPQ
jgi:hypothetical protein